MKTYVFPADKFGCGYYRLIWPAMALHNQGHDIVIVDPATRDASFQGVMNGEEMVDVKIPEDADLIVLQRVTNKYITQAVSLIRKRGVAVVIDMDDDLSRIHPANPAFEFMRPGGVYPDHSWQNAQKACENATMLVASTPALVTRYAPHGRGRMYYNHVPSYMLDIEHRDSAMVGWAGSVHSHPDDLAVLGPTMSKLLRAGHTLGVAGPGNGIHAAYGLPETAPVHISGNVDIERWGHCVTKLGVGMAPLADTQFNAAKSWLKPLEYAAVGVPCVMSPRSEYVQLHKLGIGKLADKPRDWERNLSALANSEAMRMEYSERGREVAASLTIEANAWKLAEIWDEAFKMERKKNPLGLR